VDAIWRTNSGLSSKQTRTGCSGCQFLPHDIRRAPVNGRTMLRWNEMRGSWTPQPMALTDGCRGVCPVVVHSVVGRFVQYKPSASRSWFPPRLAASCVRSGISGAQTTASVPCRSAERSLGAGSDERMLSRVKYRHFRGQMELIPPTGRPERPRALFGTTDLLPQPFQRQPVQAIAFQLGFFGFSYLQAKSKWYRYPN
jgi:hypothetical protein